MTKTYTQNISGDNLFMKVFLALLLFNYSLKKRVKHYVLPSIAFRHIHVGGDT